MIYSQSKYTNLWFFVPLKCGWSSFAKLYQNGHLINGKQYLKHIDTKVHIDVFIIRNPYDRIISLFKNKFRRDILEDHEEYIHKIIKNIFRLKSYKDIINISFREYLDKLHILKERDAHSFSLTQFYQYSINTPNYIVDINNISRIEQLLGCSLPHENTTSTISKIILTNEEKQIIKNIYQEDFDFFYPNIDHENFRKLDENCQG